MKTRVKITTMVILLVISGMSITMAQDYSSTAARRFNPLLYCMDIPDLTDAQKQNITALNEAHRKNMDELRNQKYSATDIYTRNEIDAKMLIAQNEHMRKIEASLTDAQKVYFTANITNGKPGVRAIRNNNRGGRMGQGNFRGGRGYYRGQGRGFGPGRGRF